MTTLRTALGASVLRTVTFLIGTLALTAIVGCSDSARSGPEGGGVVTGRIIGGDGSPLGGVMVSALDDGAAKSVTVFTDGDGRYELPALRPRTYRLRARRIGFADQVQSGVEVGATSGPVVDFTLSATANLNDQLPGSYYYSLLEWPSEKVKGDFTRACANCHPIGFHSFREGHSEEAWRDIVARMTKYGGVPFFDETRPLLLPTLLRAFGPGAPAPQFTAPRPPTGDATRAIVTEWEIDPERRPGCHDLELDADGVVYMVSGGYILDPRTDERRRFEIPGGGHSVERAADGAMWITAPGPETLIRYDVATGESVSYPHPRIGEDLGSYPHTLRFDDRGVIWETLTRSNHVASFDPATAQFRYYRLPPADPKESGLPIPVAYGIDVAPDQSVWWSQLFGHRIGVIRPDTGEMRSWRTPFDGPRRLFVGPDNIVWVPGYGASVLGRFDPRSEDWRVYPLPTEPRGSELPYAITVDRRSGDVWITGANSDTLIRFRPSTEQWTVFPLPTPVDFTREIEFDDEGNVWTCTSDAEIGEGLPGTGRLIRLQLLEREGRCGDGVVQLGEECDDGNAESCDGCSDACRVETGCGDGAVCGVESCDDGNRDGCDGCSSTCQPEAGGRCGDGELRADCGEECEPGVAGADPGTCTPQCRRIPTCGDGFLDRGEECDDGNRAGCDDCSSTCRADIGCGDGDVCAGEACDDRNAVSCDGCSSVCLVEPGALCGDGAVRTDCGEECDPPGTSPGDGLVCSLHCRAGDGSLGVRRFSFGGSLYSSSLGPDTLLGDLSGVFEIEAAAPDGNGVAALASGPAVYSAAILGGSYGTYCVRVAGCTGIVDCDGGTQVGVSTVQDSAGPGIQGLPTVITVGAGAAGPAGSAVLDCMQSYVQLLAGEGTDCPAASYPPASRVVYTSGRTDGLFTSANPKVGTANLTVEGEPFSCSAWQREDGPGVLVGMFLVEEDRQAGDLANANRLDD
ncbi:MAG: DUF4215 domain-containing protein [Deltaproteobacteria bacterium]|nr:DUF4215 domain-containing protein [Deltaproteobacteria bacterium]